MFDVSRILAIPEYDDLPQMGLSRAGLAAIVERGGLTKDGTKAKASVLQRAGIKGDRKLPSKPVNKFEEKLRSQFKDRADAIKSKPEQFNKNFLAKQMADAVDNEKSVLIDSVIPKIRSGNKRLTTKAKGGKTFEGGVKGVGRDSSVRRKKRAMTDRDISRNAGIAAAKLESQGQLNLFNQPKSSAAIAPDTAKKVKRAIAGVKGGKKTVKNLTAPVKTKQIESTDIKKNLKVGDNVASTYWNNQNYSMLNGKIKSIARTKATIETSYMGKPQEHTIPISNIAYIDSKRKGGRTITEVKGNNSPQKPDLQDKSLLNRLRKKRKK